jgi:hypothetical protein
MDVLNMSEYQQRGFAVLSFAGKLPMVHSFHLPEWEANNAKVEAEKLPPHLKEQLQVVPAVLSFTASGEADANG